MTTPHARNAVLALSLAAGVAQAQTFTLTKSLAVADAVQVPGQAPGVVFTDLDAEVSRLTRQQR